MRNSTLTLSVKDRRKKVKEVKLEDYDDSIRWDLIVATLALIAGLFGFFNAENNNTEKHIEEQKVFQKELMNYQQKLADAEALLEIELDDYAFALEERTDISEEQKMQLYKKLEKQRNEEYQTLLKAKPQKAQYISKDKSSAKYLYLAGIGVFFLLYLGIRRLWIIFKVFVMNKEQINYEYNEITKQMGRAVW